MAATAGLQRSMQGGARQHMRAVPRCQLTHQSQLALAGVLNSLPEAVVCSYNVSTFKCRLAKHNLDAYVFYK